ncbi:MAG: trans-2-enoyl-CoA reductase family protein [Saccharospirillaceae bacterium]|nr:trans-2-enoyl-CoA reductase family protein [Pseudomonadales bacterium]NRB79639.1 trans-2-enoyl-CoA reductase family protein [Saccharospirillaceae bacterium]
MIIKPKIRGFICTTAHPVGCAQNVKEQIQYVKDNTPAQKGAKNVLILGCSAGYGLASRITAAFGSGANTLGVQFEKEPTERKTASAGYYNTVAFEKEAKEAGLYANTFNLDAFSHEAKDVIIKEIKEKMGKVDLVVYSLAAPRRKDPDTGEIYTSTLKPIGKSVTRKNLNTDKKIVSDLTLEPASEAEIQGTIDVMGGADWELWMSALADADVLAQDVKTTSYTYIGEQLTWPIYKGATIGKAKEDLDRAAAAISEKLKASLNGSAYVSVLKAVVTQASSAIPVMPLYLSILFKVMKEDGSHEGCIEQVHALFKNELFDDSALTLDEDGRIRMDLKELRPEIQSKVEALWDKCTTETFEEMSDFKAYQEEFYRLFGFGLKGVDYEAEVETGA